MNTKLKRMISLPVLIFYGLGTMVGGGFYALLGKVVGEAGVYAPLGMLIAGFLTPWPYNYYRLKKYNIACH